MIVAMSVTQCIPAVGLRAREVGGEALGLFFYERHRMMAAFLYIDGIP